MNIQLFNNNEIRKIICNILGKNQNEVIYKEELRTIETLSINPRLFTTPSKTVNLSDLRIFNNLKNLYIRDMEIRDIEIECINTLPFLEYIQMNNCDFFKIKNILNVKNISNVSLIGCSNIDFKVLSELYNLKYLKVIGCSVKSYKGIENFYNLEELCFNNINKVDLSRTLNLNNLKYINLDGSTLKRERHKIILSNHVKVSHFEEFCLV